MKSDSNIESDEKMKSDSNTESDEKMKSESATDSDAKIMSDSNTSDSEEKKDTVPELKSAKAVAKEKGKRVIKVGKKTQSGVDQIIRKAKGLTLEAPGNVRPPVVKSSYSLRSGSRGKGVMDMDVVPTKAVGQKRKEKEKKSDAEVFRGSVKADTEEGCKKFKGRKHDDEPDKDGSGAAAGLRATRSSPRTRMVNPV
ncbi:hypothetical protein CTI12_AA605630 [Artemisia annua]|uniref:Uncharacterized protein n=1 Tax=Artemisia annua TaxID=35608 RepID=A0A2U1KGF2_ARTAN|nr:hypothetical protein CTI12_AA605630 [Artemisia annua]